MKILGFSYLFGDPVMREKVSRTLRISVKSIIGALACIGLGALLATICQIAAW